MIHSLVINKLRELRVLLLSATVCCVMTGCGNAISDINDTYLSRLANTLNLSPPDTVKLSNLNVPHYEFTAQQQTTIGLLQLAQLNQCKLAGLVAEHNNQLGKTASPANVFKYHLEFIQASQQCLQTLPAEQKVHQQIMAASNTKKRDLIHYFNAMLYNEIELARAWQLTYTPLTMTTAGVVETEHALSYFIKIKQHIASNDIANIDSLEIVKQLEILNTFRFNQKLISSARQQAAYNQITSQFLKQVDLQSLCRKSRNNQQATILHNIFNKFYLKKIQPYQAYLVGTLERMLPLYETLWQSPALNVLLDDNSEQHLLNNLKSSAKQHVIWWQKFYKTCEISPT
ncbi:DUF3080 family protein [Pseudoalteromonas mariniglutinosa]|uniref:DUF3080 family protein n=1 Tax=Pseudoalteromonas mariniglutinosa TaxID=206042 RepID=UPI00384C0FC6